jgi:penicillin-binding protein 1C
MRIAVARMGPLPLADANTVSVTVLDREDRLLRAFTTSEGRWRLPLDPAEVDPRYLAMLMAFEDKRFYDHGGVDPFALARAGLLLVRHGRIVSGGSTLTMQVARLLEGRHERTGAGKLHQIARALQLEGELSKTGNSPALSEACAIRRQHRGRARRVPRLFRQGAAPSFCG